MEQLTANWLALSLGRKVTVVLATLATLAAVLLLAQAATAPRMALLYAGLEPTAAGEVVSALEAQGVAFDIRGNAIYVDGARRDALRLSLAGEGLPSNGSQGYELLDSLTGFGTTSQMFDVAYWRAKEGELARTIVANRQISAARVHLSNPTNSPFSRGEVSSASVSVTTTGAGLSAPQAMALRHLVAAAVSGLSAKDVAVIDSRHGLVPVSETGLGTPGAETRADDLRMNITRLLEARVGAGNAIVEVNVDTINERETISERLIDPDSRVAISSENEENSSRSNDDRGGAVTVASNLPEGDANGSGQRSESTESRSREIVNYEVSETQRSVLREPGAVRRITVAALVDGVRVVGDDGTERWQPRSDQELESLRELVASAVGFDTARGDTITIKSLEFQTPSIPAASEPISWMDRFAFDAMALIQLLVLAAVSLILGLLVVRPLLVGRHSGSVGALPAPPNRSGASDLPALEAPDLDLDALGSLSNPIAIGGMTEDPAQRLRRLIDGRRDETVEVLAQWMRDKPEQVS